MQKIRTSRPLIKVSRSQTVKIAPKRADDFYHSPEWKAARAKALKRAKWRCEVVENGQRCERRHPAFRMTVDHIVERRDGGADLDPSNLMCVCDPHHGAKTAAERAKRARW